VRSSASATTARLDQLQTGLSGLDASLSAVRADVEGRVGVALREAAAKAAAIEAAAAQSNRQLSASVAASLAAAAGAQHRQFDVVRRQLEEVVAAKVGQSAAAAGRVIETLRSDVKCDLGEVMAEGAALRVKIGALESIQQRLGQQLEESKQQLKQQQQAEQQSKVECAVPACTTAQPGSRRSGKSAEAEGCEVDHFTVLTAMRASTNPASGSSGSSGSSRASTSSGSSGVATGSGPLSRQSSTLSTLAAELSSLEADLAPEAAFELKAAVSRLEGWVKLLRVGQRRQQKMIKAAMVYLGAAGGEGRGREEVERLMGKEEVAEQGEEEQQA
jgi:hypothetical protein